MKCVIPGVNLKVFGKAIHSLAKIGDEIYFEAQPDGLAVRTVNSSRSAFASFFFKTTFFTKFSDGSNNLSVSVGQNNNDENANKPSVNNETLKYKVYTKSCLTVFKSLSSLDKTVDKCKISLNIHEDRLIFQLHCRHGLVKTYNLTFIECEKLQAVFNNDKNHNHNFICAQSKLFNEVVSNFQSSVEELNVTMLSDKVVVKNHVDDNNESSKLIKTEVVLELDEFDEYNHSSDSQAVFCLKEFRALLFFCEMNNLPISVYFEEAGKPIIFTLDSDPSFQSHFVLVTLTPDYLTSTTDGHSSVTMSANKKSIKRKSTESMISKKKQILNLKKLDNSNNNNDNDYNNNDINVVVAVDVGDDNVLKNISNVNDVNRLADYDNDDSSGNRNITNIHFVNNDNNNGNNNNGNNKKDVDNDNRDISDSVKYLNNGDNKKIRFKLFDLDDDDEVQQKIYDDVVGNSNNSNNNNVEKDDDDDDDVIPGTPPGTPPSKKFHSLFFGLSQSQDEDKQIRNRSYIVQNNNIKMNCNLFAEDSDVD